MTLFKLYVLENIQLYNSKRLEKLNTVEKKFISLYKSSETNHWLWYSKFKWILIAIVFFHTEIKKPYSFPFSVCDRKFYFWTNSRTKQTCDRDLHSHSELQFEIKLYYKHLGKLGIRTEVWQIDSQWKNKDVIQTPCQKWRLSTASLEQTAS